MAMKNHYGPILGRIRRERSLKAEYVARQIGISPTTYSRIEQGLCSATYERVAEICRQLDFSMQELEESIKSMEGSNAS